MQTIKNLIRAFLQVVLGIVAISLIFFAGAVATFGPHIWFDARSSFQFAQLEILETWVWGFSFLFMFLVVAMVHFLNWALDKIMGTDVYEIFGWRK